MTYVPLVRKTSGGDELAIAAGGSFKIAGIDFLTTGGYVGDQRVWYEKTTESTGTLTNYGVSVLVPAAAGVAGDKNKSFYVEPALGRIKTVVCMLSTSTSLTTVITTGTWDGSNKNLHFSSGLVTDPDSITAIGISTSAWYVTHMSSDVTFSNT